LNLENVLYIEDRLSSINDLLKAMLPQNEAMAQQVALETLQ
jgi:hypothetical protein